MKVENTKEVDKMNLIKYVLDMFREMQNERRQCYEWCFEDPEKMERRLRIYDEVNMTMRGQY
ncbi:MAG: hypothetical protein J4400_04455 [Candidatus Aenigmarchaeota archaeon]|nr:hypothetical protein [Candidatus Aenigmarchaeota archaeon]